jgi:hypothetical protein
MLRLLRRLGDTAGSHPNLSDPDARSGAHLLSSFFEPAKTLFVNGTGFKPSLTLFWLFMAVPWPSAIASARQILPKLRGGTCALWSIRRFRGI